MITARQLRHVELADEIRFKFGPLFTLAKDLETACDRPAKSISGPATSACGASPEGLDRRVQLAGHLPEDFPDHW
jgi:hypothetical protein